MLRVSHLLCLEKKPNKYSFTGKPGTPVSQLGITLINEPKGWVSFSFGFFSPPFFLS